MGSIFHNPIVKTLASLIAGIAFPAIDIAVQHPTGGLADALAKNPAYAYMFTGAALFVHNLISRYQFAASTEAAPSAPLIHGK